MGVLLEYIYIFNPESLTQVHYGVLFLLVEQEQLGMHSDTLSTFIISPRTDSIITLDLLGNATQHLTTTTTTTKM